VAEWDRVIEEAESTNDLARELAQSGAPHGAWISARRQTRGRGRAGRSWDSREGNLFLSMIVREVPRAHWTWIPLAAGIAGARAIARVAPEVATRIKWPNDLRVGEAKLGGILCEGDGSFAVVGIGVNCREAPSGLDQVTTSLSRESSRAVTADELRPALVLELRLALAELSRGTSSTASEYERLSAFPPGSRIRWGAHEGEVEGLGSFGELLVRAPGGNLERLFAEEIS
jgi:BirA family biotin operon repressor/biotin-[acetyl-CoA-carboxylase] ligase